MYLGTKRILRIATFIALAYFVFVSVGTYWYGGDLLAALAVGVPTFIVVFIAFAVGLYVFQRLTKRGQ